MVTEIEYDERMDMFEHRLVESITTRENLLKMIESAGDDKLTDINMDLNKLEEYRKRTDLLKTVLGEFRQICR